MNENCSFTLNLTRAPALASATQKSTSVLPNFDDGTPLISFASKPTKTSASGSTAIRKPCIVLRRKAPAGVKRKLSDVKLVQDTFDVKTLTNTNALQNESSSYISTSTGTSRNNARSPTGIARRTPASGRKNVANKWAVSENDKSKSKEYKNTGVISSLFRMNPEIPTMAKDSVKSADENVFSTRSFSDLKIHDYLVATLEKDLGLSQMTEAQSQAIPILLMRKDALIKSQTGSGKTLAYAIPIVQSLQCITPKIDRTSGIFALVIVPTRELVLQTYSWVEKLIKPFKWIVPGYLIGGEKKKSEKARIRKGINILISTPGRLLDHLSSTRNLNLGRLHWLVLDEADRLLDMGYEKDVAKIISTVQEHYIIEGGIGRRQNVMLSATLSAGVEKLAGLALTDPEQVNLSEDGSVNQDQLVTPTNLKQWYLLVPPKLRLVTLAAFILWKCTLTTEKKMLIFLTTQDTVDYHADLFERVIGNREGGTKIHFFKLHGNMAQKDRTAIFKEYRDTDNGVLLCTDVAARGLDLTSVDWIVQYNPPVTAEDYVHRVGRTARVGKCGQAVIMLSPAEAQYVPVLAKRGISLTEKNPDVILKTLTKTWSRVTQSMEQAATSLQLALEETVIDSYNLSTAATKGYVSFVRSYATFPREMREIFNMKELHLGHYAKSFALRDPPARINSAGRSAAKRAEPFRTARERNPKRPQQDVNTATRSTGRQSTYERRAIMSEFASGLDPPPFKRAR